MSNRAHLRGLAWSDVIRLLGSEFAFMLPIALTVLLWIPPLLGLGSLLHYRGDAALRRSVSGLLGTACVATLAMSIHFLAPIGPSVSMGLWATGAVLFAIRRRWLAESVSWSEVIGAGAALGLLVWWMQPPRAVYDSGLYYLQAVRWTSAHPLHSGLALLHNRFGFNSAWYAVSAALELPFLKDRSALLANLFPVVFTAAAAGVGIARVIRGSARYSDLVLAFGFAVIWPMASTPGAATPDSLAGSTPDGVVTLLVYLTLALWTHALDADDAGFRDEARPAVLLTALAILVKLTAVPLLAATILALIWRRQAISARWLMTTATLSGLMVLPWAIRSVFLSGCVFFPSAWSCLSGLSWAVPREEVRALAEVVTAWAKTPSARPEDVLGNWAWMATWLARMASRDDIRLFGSAAVAGLVLWLATWRRTPSVLAIPLVTCLLGIACVFLIAPEPRFGLGFLYGAAFLPMLFGLNRLGWLSGRWGRGLVVVILVLGVRATWKRHEASGWTMSATTFPSLPVVDTSERTTTWGIQVRVPVTGDQCWAAPEPCTPYFRSSLKETERGFTLGR